MLKTPEASKEKVFSTKSVWLLGWIEPSSPLTKELDGQTVKCKLTAFACFKLLPLCLLQTVSSRFHLYDRVASVSLTHSPTETIRFEIYEKFLRLHFKTFDRFPRKVTMLITKVIIPIINVSIPITNVSIPITKLNHGKQKISFVFHG